MRTLLPVLSFLLVVAACAEPAAPPATAPDLPVLETRADSLAMDLYNAFGGPEAWATVRYIRFDFGRQTDSTKTVFRRHLWDRFTGEYRVEWEQEGASVVALINVNTQEGRAFVDGEPVADDANADYVRRAYRGYINDTYWLMAPTKLLDPGVSRAYAADSSSAQFDVVTTTYDNVGLTPGDQFWFWIDRNTGMLDTWGYVLQGQEDRPITKWKWMDYQTFETAGGTVTVGPRKNAMSGSTALMTDNVALPETVDPDAFTQPGTML